MKKSIILFVAMVTVCSCQKDELSLKVAPREITLYANETQQLTTSAKKATYFSDDEFYASVSANGLVTANKVGTTIVRVSGSGITRTVSVAVKPKYLLFPTLDVLIGKTKSEVRSLLGASYTVKDNQWTYPDFTSYTALILQFVNEKVDSAGLSVPTAYAKQLAGYLVERYAVIGMKDDYYFFLNHDKNVVIAMKVYSASYIGVVYMVRSDTQTPATVCVDSILTAL